MKRLCILLILTCFFSAAQAQIRTEGQFPFRKSSQEQIEKAIEDALKSGKIKTNSLEWERIMHQLNKHKERAVDSLAFASLNKNGYFIDRTNTKNYLIYIEEISTYYIARVVDCQSVPSPLHGNRCALGITTIRALESNNSQLLSRKEKKDYLSKFYKYAIQSGRINIQ